MNLRNTQPGMLAHLNCSASADVSPRPASTAPGNGFMFTAAARLATGADLGKLRDDQRHWSLLPPARGRATDFQQLSDGWGGRSLMRSTPCRHAQCCRHRCRARRASLQESFLCIATTRHRTSCVATRQKPALQPRYPLKTPHLFPRSLWTATQPLLLPGGDAGLRMTIARLPDGSLWVGSAVCGHRHRQMSRAWPTARQPAATGTPLSCLGSSFRGHAHGCCATVHFCSAARCTIRWRLLGSCCGLWGRSAPL